MKTSDRLITELNQSSIAKIRKLRLGLCIACALLGCLWVGFEKLVVPHWSAQDGLLVCLGFGLLAWITTSPTFFNRFVGEATPEALGAIRILSCTILFVMTLWIEDLPSTALLPEEMRHPTGIIQFFYALPGFESFVRSQTSLQVFEWLIALVLFLGIIGWQTRVVIPLGAFCYLLLGGIVRHYTWFFHTGLIPIYVLAVLSLTPCGDGLSVDRLRKVAQGRAVPAANRAAPVYGWSRYACWTIVALPYVAAGMSKIRRSGLFWWHPDNMRSFLYAGTLDPMQFDWGLSVQLSHAPDIVFALLGIAGVYGEVAFGAVLFSRVARWIMPIFMIGTHLGIFFLQNILFFDLIFLLLIFFDFDLIKKTIEKLVSRQKLRSQNLEGLVPIDRQEVLINRSKQPEIKPPEKLVTNKQEITEQKRVASFREILVNFRYPLIISALTAILILNWANRNEFYPLTAMPMFSGRNTTGTVGYNKVLAHYESGAIARAYPERIIPALFDTRYRLVLKGCFSKVPKRTELCDKFFQAAGSVHNKKAKIGEKITQFELQSWHWNFRANPSDPKHGTLAERYIVKVDQQ